MWMMRPESIQPIVAEPEEGPWSSVSMLAQPSLNLEGPHRILGTSVESNREYIKKLRARFWKRGSGSRFNYSVLVVSVSAGVSAPMATFSTSSATTSVPLLCYAGFQCIGKYFIHRT